MTPFEILDIIAARRGTTREALVAKAVENYVSYAIDNAMRYAMQAARDEGWRGSFTEYQQAHPDCWKVYLK